MSLCGVKVGMFNVETKVPGSSSDEVKTFYPTKHAYIFAIGGYFVVPDQNAAVIAVPIKEMRQQNYSKP